MSRKLRAARSGSRRFPPASPAEVPVPAETVNVETLPVDTVLGTPEASLLDVIDNVLNKGVVVSGDITIALAQVDLVYARLSLLLCAADRVLPHEDRDLMTRRHGRLSRRRRTRP